MSVSEILNKDVSDILGPSEEGLSDVLATTKKSDVSALTATDEKIFTEIDNEPSSQPKVFSIHETKQAVSEINFEPVVAEKTRLITFPTWKVTNLANKTGVDIKTDSDIKKAETKVSSKLSDIKSSSASLSEDTLAAIPKVTIPAIPTLPDPSVFTADVAAEALLPDGIDKSTFDSMRDDFNTYLNSFNTCPDVTTLFSYDTKILDTEELLQKMRDFLDVSAGLDFDKVMDCLSDGFGLLDVVDKQGLLASAISTGSLGSVSTALDTISAGLVKDATGSAFDTLNNFSGDLSDQTNSDLADGLMTKLGVNKANLFSTGSGERSLNASIMDDIGSPLYDATASAKAAVGESGVGAWSIGAELDELLANIP